MKILLSWLQDYVDIQETPERIADALLMSGTEVDAIHQPGKNIKNVVVGQIISCQDHPNADNLLICTVDVGEPELVIIVCGAKNVKSKDKVPVARIGATLPSGVEIRKACIREVQSFGMLCSRRELGISDDHSGIYILSEDLPIGQDISQTLGMADTIFEISPTPNRGDELSHLGIARELSAIFNLPLRRNVLDGTEGESDVKTISSVSIEAPDLCRRYGARVIENVSVGKSPNWLRDRLEKVGVRSINNIVDITNYVMLDIGHPMHAFDFDTLNQKRIVVRLARRGEIMKTLDGTDRQLDPSMLVIADAEKSVALGGVMGGLESEVTDKTKRILLEAAAFDPISIRKTSKALGLMSESSYRFERGINISNIPIALNLAVRLISEISGGKPYAGLIDAYPKIAPLRQIAVRPRKVSRYLGIDLKIHQIETILLRLKLDVSKDGDALMVGVPPFRHDLQQEVDVIEEVARIYGYEKIPNTLPRCPSVPQPTSEIQSLKQRVRDHLVSVGFHETITYSFIPIGIPACMQEGVPLRLTNPLSEDQGILRTSLTYGIFDSLRRNILADEYDLKLFEIGRVFHRGMGDLTQERERLCIGVSGRQNSEDWSQNSKTNDIFLIKGIISGLGAIVGHSFQFSQAKRELFHPVFQFEVRCQNRLVGHLGRIHPRFLENKKIPEEIFLAEIDLDTMAELQKRTPGMKPIPEFPPIRRDLAFVLPTSVSHDEIKDMLLSKGGCLLESCALFDVYQGKGIENEKRSLAFSMSFRSPERTLKDSEIDPIIETMIEAVKQKFKGFLR